MEAAQAGSTIAGLVIAGLQKLLAVCFAAGTPLLTPEGSKPIEQFRVGDLILSRDENNREGPVQAKVVEEIFVRTGRILHLHVGGQLIRTTAEHPFFVKDMGWTDAVELHGGDLLASHDGRWIAVEEVFDTGEFETVYNLRVADWHTYFVGEPQWGGWSVWAHNLSCGELKTYADAYATKVAANKNKTPKGIWNQIGNGRQFTQSEKSAIRDYLRDPANNYQQSVLPKKRNQAGKPGNPDHDATVDTVRQMARREFPDDIIVTGKNMKNYPGKTKGVSGEPDAMVIDKKTGEVKKVYEAARTEADGVTFKKREDNKKKKYDRIGLDSHFEPVR